MVPSSLFLVWHFQQQVTPNYASYRYTTPFAIATNTPIFGKLNPDQNLNTLAMPKIHECDRCLLYARNPHLVCAVHPAGPNTNTCLDFRADPNAAAEELWEPEGASYNLDWRFRNLKKPPVLQPRVSLKYRGVYYQTGTTPTPNCTQPTNTPDFSTQQ